jgi:hypothetical protein
MCLFEDTPLSHSLPSLPQMHGAIHPTRRTHPCLSLSSSFSTTHGTRRSASRKSCPTPPPPLAQLPPFSAAAVAAARRSKQRSTNEKWEMRTLVSMTTTNRAASAGEWGLTGVGIMLGGWNKDELHAIMKMENPAYESSLPGRTLHDHSVVAQLFC